MSEWDVRECPDCFGLDEDCKSCEGIGHIEEINTALRVGTLASKFTPILCGAAFKNKGVQQLLDAVVAYLPSPQELKDIV